MSNIKLIEQITKLREKVKKLKTDISNKESKSLRLICSQNESRIRKRNFQT